MKIESNEKIEISNKKSSKKFEIVNFVRTFFLCDLVSFGICDFDFFFFRKLKQRKAIVVILAPEEQDF